MQGSQESTAVAGMGSRSDSLASVSDTAAAQQLRGGGDAGDKVLLARDVRAGLSESVSRQPPAGEVLPRFTHVDPREPT